MDLGTRLRKLRLERGLTQTQLAEPHYSYAFVSSIEAGRRNPSRKALEHFANKLGVQAAELATGRSPAIELELMASYLGARAKLASVSEEDAQEAEKRLKQIGRRAHELSAHDIEAKTQLAVALAAETRNELNLAERLYRQVEETPDLTLVTRIDALTGRARVLQSQGRSTLGAFILREALAKLNDNGLEDPASLMRLHTSLVAAYYGEGLIEQALESAEIAQRLTPRVEDPEKLADMNLNSGIVLTKLGRLEEATARLAEAERWFQQLGRDKDRADVQLVRGIGLREQGRHDEAAEVLASAQAVFATAGAVLSEARALNELGWNARLAGDVEQARFFLKRALKLAGEEPGVIAIAHREMGLCETDKPKAVRQIRKAIDLLREAGNARELATTYAALGDVLSREEKPSPATDAYKAAAQVMMAAR